MSRARCTGLQRLLALGLVLVGLIACADGSSTDDGSNNGTAPTQPLAENACKPLAPIHPIPNCDGCTRDVCCDQVLACENTANCPQLRGCYQTCARGDVPCSESCRSKFSVGASALDAIDRCAQQNCPIPCGTATVGG